MPHDPPATQREFPPVATQRRRDEGNEGNEGDEGNEDIKRYKTLQFEIETNARIYVRRKCRSSLTKGARPKSKSERPRNRDER